MNNIIYINQLDWNTLLMLKKSIKFYIESKDPKYNNALTKYTKMFNDSIKEFKAA